MEEIVGKKRQREISAAANMKEDIGKLKARMVGVFLLCCAVCIGRIVCLFLGIIEAGDITSLALTAVVIVLALLIIASDMLKYNNLTNKYRKFCSENVLSESDLSKSSASELPQSDESSSH